MQMPVVLVVVLASSVLDREPNNTFKKKQDYLERELSSRVALHQTFLVSSLRTYPDMSSRYWDLVKVDMSLW